MNGDDKSNQKNFHFFKKIYIFSFVKYKYTLHTLTLILFERNNFQKKCNEKILIEIIGNYQMIQNKISNKRITKRFE